MTLLFISDFLVTAHIFEKCSDSLTPGDLTDLRSALVNNITLASIVVRYGIHKFLLARSAKLNELITKFVIQQENHNFSVGNDVSFENVLCNIIISNNFSLRNPTVCYRCHIIIVCYTILIYCI